MARNAAECGARTYKGDGERARSFRRRVFQAHLGEFLAKGASSEISRGSILAGRVKFRLGVGWRLRRKVAEGCPRKYRTILLHKCADYAAGTIRVNREKLAAPAHKNDAYEEILYGIQGILTWTVDGMLIEVGPGQALCIPRGVVHRFDNLGSEDVKQLAVITPAMMGPAYFREAAEVIGAAAGGPPDRAKMMDVFRRHGMTVAAPPPAK